jgi:hypothetical protein
MPTKHPPILNHHPISSDALSAIDQYVGSKTPVIAEHFQKHYDIALEESDVESLTNAINEALVRFSLTSTAVPLRSPNQLVATVKKIAEEPARFLAELDRYDPEAAARVVSVYARNPEARDQFLRFEAGLGPPPPAEDIASAAKQFLREVEEHKGASGTRKGGRPIDDLQTELAIELGRLYVGFGGSLGRSVHDGEYGPFHEFLEIVLPAVRQHGRLAKSSLTTTTMVRAAQRDQEAGAAPQ